ncbi:MAG: NGG1p interacting factor NIF3 [Candidatus Omnitrophica bacterium]|nr:NGG1p interacting factor NIF3 [Candidatus Omnitrophota bacterium]
MKLFRLYNQVIKFGRAGDPRKKTRIDSYPDTAILYGEADTQIKKILIGIDIEVGELLLADKIRKQQGLDLVISHHPQGKALVSLYKVMGVQVDLLRKLGLSKSVAQELLEERKREVERRFLPHNHMRAVDAARLLDLPFMCAHTPADNHAHGFIQGLLNKEKPKKLKDIVDILMNIPEYRQAAGDLAGPRIILGNPNRPAGKISLEMTGGTSGPKEAFARLYKAGIRTLVCMHMNEEHFKKVKDINLNVIIAGHISSDTLGLNLLLDRIEKEDKEKFQVINCSGFHRIQHN